MSTQRTAPVEAIQAKKREAAANIERIRKALNTLQRNGQPINVRSVAKAAGVSVDTVRRSGDLYAEVKHLREQTSGVVAGNVARSGPSAPEKALKARLLGAQAEITELRREVAEARRAAHQALGTAGTIMDADAAQRLQQENAELTVALGQLREQVALLTSQQQETTEELTAAREVNREYARELNRTREELLRAEQALVAARTASRD